MQPRLQRPQPPQLVTPARWATEATLAHRYVFSLSHYIRYGHNRLFR